MGAASQFRAVKGHRHLSMRGTSFYFRKAVPADVRWAFDGRPEVQTSLGQVSLAEARRSVADHSASFDQKLREARGEQPPMQIVPISRTGEPSKDELNEAVRVWWKNRVDRDYLPTFEIEQAQEQIVELDVVAAEVQRGISLGAARPSVGTEWIAAELLRRNGWKLGTDSQAYRHLLRTIGRGQMEWAQRRSREIKGEAQETGDSFFAPDQYLLDEHRNKSRIEIPPVSLRKLFQGYLDERKPAPATVKAYRRFVEAFIEFLGHDDVGKMTSKDVVAWKEHLLSELKVDGKPRSSKTVGETYLSAVKTVFQWGFENHHLDDNPASRVKVRQGRAVQTRSKGFSQEEAHIILAATLQKPSSRWSPERAFAHRWVPWLCAYTGARVDEMAQLRSQDVQQREGVWCILITPEAGSIKDNTARFVPLHSHIIEQGFVDEALKRKGNLFFDPGRHRGGSDAHPQSKKVGQRLCDWVRKLGIEGVAPNHGWRHRFKTQARLVDMDRELRDAMQGHAPRTEGEEYGDHPSPALLREIEKLHRYNVASDQH